MITVRHDNCMCHYLRSIVRCNINRKEKLGPLCQSIFSNKSRSHGQVVSRCLLKAYGAPFQASLRYSIPDSWLRLIFSRHIGDVFNARRKIGEIFDPMLLLLLLWRRLKHRVVQVAVAAAADAVGRAEPGVEVGHEADGRLFGRRGRYEIEKVRGSNLVQDGQGGVTRERRRRHGAVARKRHDRVRTKFLRMT